MRAPLVFAWAVAAVLVAAPLVAANAQPAGGAAAPWKDIGRAATPAEIRAWDIDVRPDFRGLPPGSGSVDKGMDVWDAQCASCHGTFGESNEVFTPIVGGTTRRDIETGRVANLVRPDFPQRTTLMKLPTLSTLWDYINRAMPWNAPKTLSVEEVYAVTAYILHLGDIVPADFVLSDRNIGEVQKRLPNRDGMAKFPGLWTVRGKPDVQGDACMTNCRTEVEVRSMLPEHARNAHGNLADQQRLIGPMRGADTTRPASREPLRLATAAPATAVAVRAAAAPKPPAQIARDAACLACHGVANRLVGPSLREIAERYKADPKALDLLAGRVRKGAQGTWGPIPMPANTTLSDGDVRSVVQWILGGAS